MLTFKRSVVYERKRTLLEKIPLHVFKITIHEISHQP